MTPTPQDAQNVMRLRRLCQNAQLHPATAKTRTPITPMESETRRSIPPRRAGSPPLDSILLKIRDQHLPTSSIITISITFLLFTNIPQGVRGT